MSTININLTLDKETVGHFIDAFKGFEFYNNLQPKENNKEETLKTYTCKEAEDLLKLDEKTIQRYCSKGLIKASKNGKSWIIKESEIKKYLDNN